MTLIKLLHPTLGLCAQQVAHGHCTEIYITNMWKKKYGKKVNECVMERVVTKNERLPNPRCTKVINIETGEIYQSIAEASREMRMSKSSITDHCKRKLTSGRIKYRVRYA